MKLQILTLILILSAFLFSSCVKDTTKRIEVPINNTATKSTPIPKPTKRTYTEPEIGMLYTDFSALCMKPFKGTSQDSWNTLKTARGTIDTIRRDYTPNRDKYGCVGSFTFVDGVLDSIYSD